jgi:hypothetical protein
MQAGTASPHVFTKAKFYIWLLEEKSLTALRNCNIGVATTAAEAPDTRKPGLEASNALSAAGLSDCHCGSLVVAFYILIPLV